MRAYTKRACMQCGRSWGKGVKLGTVTMGGSRLCVRCAENLRDPKDAELERLYREAMRK